MAFAVSVVMCSFCLSLCFSETGFGYLVEKNWYNMQFERQAGLLMHL